MSGEIPFDPIEIEQDVPVPAQDLEVPAHVELERVEDAIDRADDEFMADASARLAERASELATPAAEADLQPDSSPDTQKTYARPERSEADKEVARDNIRRIGEAIGRERRRKIALSITSKRLRY